ncbi:hypothetical protein AB0F11_30135 [Streptomyces sp. NPDC032472]
MHADEDDARAPIVVETQATTMVMRPYGEMDIDRAAAAGQSAS